MSSDAWGISDGYFDVDGGWHATSERTRSRVREAMGEPAAGAPLWFVPVGATDGFWNPCRIVTEDGTDLGAVDALPADLPIGYHRLIPVDGSSETSLIVHPRRCPALPRAWGAAAQVYALWSERSWGIGDLHDLRTLCASLFGAGGRAMLVSPLHEATPTVPQQTSPYYPSSRRRIGAMLLGLDGDPASELRCDPSQLIDRDIVWPAKRAALETLFAIAADSDPTLATFDIATGDRVAAWNALCERFGPDWSIWPDGLHRPDEGALAAAFADDDLRRAAAFHAWCHGEAARQLTEAASEGVAIIGDLAVGFSPTGADAWEFQDLLALDMRLGAPSDPFNTDGQDWGIPPFVPWRLRAAGYAPFIETIRAALRGVQGLRIDHVMGMFRQFWIPVGASPAEGAYVEFPAAELLAILAIEATRAGTFVIGEDLGTVEPVVRTTLAEARIAGTKVLWFEPEPPSAWPENCLATITTHDLPTIAGVVAGTDGDSSAHDRLTAATAATPPGPDHDPRPVIAAAHAALLGSPAALRLVSMDDVTASTQRPNHPGTLELPNWQRRLPVSVDHILAPRG